MTQLTTSTSSTSAFALLSLLTLIPLGVVAACGSSDTDAGSSGVGSSSGGGGTPFQEASNNGSSGSSGNNSSGGNNNNAPTTTPVLAPGAVNLGLGRHFAILSKSGISTVPTSVIKGNLGVSPAAASYITGFSLSAHSTNVFATSPQVTGGVYAADYAVPTPSNLTTAIGDIEIAFTDAASRAPKATELGAGNIGGMTISPGVYKWGTGVLISSNVTLAGSANDVWIFQIAQNLAVESAVKITLSGGAAARNIFWQVAGSADFGTTSHFEGVVLAQTSIALRTGASINGRLLSQTAVTVDSSTVTQPAW